MKKVELLFGILLLVLVSCAKEVITQSNEGQNQTEHTRIKEVSDGDDEADDGDDSELNLSLIAPDGNTLIYANSNGELYVLNELLDDLIGTYFEITPDEAEMVRNDLVEGFVNGEFDHLGCPIIQVESDIEDELLYIWE